MGSLTQMMQLDGRVALITGGAGHIGRAISETLAEMGASVILVDLDEEETQKIASQLTSKYGVRTAVITADLENHDSVQEIPKIVNSDFGRLDILVNNAAFVGSSDLSGWAETFEKQSTETWRRAIEVNLTAVFTLCQQSSPLMRGLGSSSIINIGSIYGALGPDLSLYENTSMQNPAAYAASKGGLLQLTRWLATVLAPDIRVNAICPGGMYRGQPDNFVNRYCERTPLKRMAVEDDIKGAIAYLASDLSAYVTGQVLMVDGGWSTW